MRGSPPRGGNPTGEPRAPGSTALWATALAVTLAAAAWQWHTLPSWPREGKAEVGGLEVPYRLPRDGTTGEPPRVSLPAAPEVTGNIRWRPYPADESFRGLTMLRDGDRLVGLLPSQPPGVRLEYSLVLAGPFGLARIPEDGPLVMRFEGPVPPAVRFAHLALLLASFLVGVRAGLAALRGRPETRRLTWIAFGGFTAGALILGTVVRIYAFDALWAGWPLGHDPAGEATLILWVAWTVAAAAVGGGRRPADRFGRTVVVLATVITVVVSLIPHTLRG